MSAESFALQHLNLPQGLNVNPYGYWQLLHDTPSKRRKAYLELNFHSEAEARAELAKFHVEVAELKTLLNPALSTFPLRCFVTTSAHSLLQLLTGSPQVSSARVDLREYALQTTPLPE